MHATSGGKKPPLRNDSLIYYYECLTNKYIDTYVIVTGQRKKMMSEIETPGDTDRMQRIHLYFKAPNINSKYVYMYIHIQLLYPPDTLMRI